MTDFNLKIQIYKHEDSSTCIKCNSEDIAVQKCRLMYIQVKANTYTVKTSFRGRHSKDASTHI